MPFNYSYAFSTTLNKIQGHRTKYEQAEKELGELVQRKKLEAKRLQSLTALGKGEETEATQLKASLSTLETSISQKNTELSKSVSDLLKDRETLTSLGGSDKLKQWSDDFPILLLPVRLETRFMRIKHVYKRSRETGEAYPRYRDTFELWVRVFPDDIHASTFEASLTEEELTTGKQFWENFYAQSDEVGHLGAWRGLCTAFGVHRSAYVAEQTAPPEYDKETQLFSGVPTWMHLDDIPKRSASWTKAPHTQLLPDRFTFITERGGTRNEYQGKLIPEHLQLGIDPESETEEDFDQENGSLNMPEGLRWMTDFDAAVEAGMAIKIELSTTDPGLGFDRVMALGVKLSADPEESKDFVEHMIQHHRYTDGGFAIVPQGTPTNNTEEGSSGYNEVELDPDTMFAAERLNPLFEAASDSSDKKDGQWLADALGIDYSALEHILHAGGADIAEGQMMNQALWPATLKNYLSTLLYPAFTEAEVSEAETFFKEYVSGRGMAPAFRIGNQPYGILPTTAFSKWKYSETDSQHSFHKNLFEGLLTGMSTTWSELGNMVKHVGADSISDLSEDFMNIIGLHASSVDFYQRFFIGSEFFSNLVKFREEKSGYNYNPSGNGITDEEWTSLTDRYNFDLANDPFVYDVLAMDEERNLNGPVVTDQPLSEEDSLPGIGESSSNYIKWLSSATHDFVKNENFSNIGAEADADAPQSLLYLILRHALLLEYANSSLKVLVEAGKLSSYAVKPQEMLGIADIQFSSQNELELEGLVSKEQRFFFDPDKLGGSGPLSGPTNPLFTPMSSPFNPFGSSGASGSGSNDNPILIKEIDFKKAELTGTSPNFRNTSLAVESVTGTMKMGDFLDREIMLKTPNSQSLRKLKSTLAALQNLPTARLERAFAEHVDLCSHRLDAWMLGLVNERLFSKRNASETRQTGLYLGAAGWVDELEKGGFDGVHVREVFRKSGAAISSRSKSDYTIGEQVDHFKGEYYRYLGYNYVTRLELDADAKRFRARVASDSNNQGFIHTPSLNHAVTAAILRSGYMAHYDADDPNTPLAVNLDSKRVRKAIYYLEGMQNGQSLGALLGYQFERLLHENEDGLELDKYIYDLRVQYPLVSGGVVDNDSGDSIETVEASNVIDGLQLVEGYREAQDGGSDWLSELTFDSTTEKDAINAAADTLMDHLDAISDLTLTESVFQIARGNQERAKAMLNAVSGNSSHFPMPQVQETPRTGDVLTHKVFVQLDTEAEAKQWTYRGTQRSFASAPLNKWLADSLGNGRDIVVQTKADWTDDTGAEKTRTIWYSMYSLGLEAIDLVHLVGAQLESPDQGELMRLLTYRTRLSVRDNSAKVEVKLSATNASTGKTPLIHLLPLIESLWEMVKDSRPLRADDLQLSGTSETGTGGIDLAAFRAQVKELMDHRSAPYQMKRTMQYLNIYVRYVRDREDWGRFMNSLRSRLVYAFNLGVPGSIPESAYGDSEEDRAILIAQGERVLERVKQRYNDAQAKWDEADDASEAAQLKAYQEIAELLYGPSFSLIPTFSLHNPDEITQAHAHTNTGNLLSEGGDFPMDEWLQGISRVRERMHNLQQFEVLKGTIQGTFEETSLQPVQLPHTLDESGQANSKWLGIEFPDDYEVPGDTLSLVGSFIPGYDPNGLQCGLLVDEWNEVIPHKEETTGIALHFDQPDAQAPQSLLLVVTPEETGSWKWDDLVDSIGDTLDLARQRAVEPDLLTDTGFPQVLPMLWFALSGEEGVATLDLAHNMSTTFSGVFNSDLRYDFVNTDLFLYKP